MNPGVLPSNPFVAGGMLEDPRLFVGRKYELNALVSRMTGAQPTSINIYGDKRIGKSSLLYHFVQTWETRVADSSRYVVIYLSLQSASCQREEDFYLAVAQELISSSAVRKKPSLINALQVSPLNRQAFSVAMAEFKNQGLLPVICLDDFQALFKHPQEFNDGFYDNLRSLMDNNKLMLVIASRKKVDWYAKKNQLTSTFFNLGHILRLDELTPEEAKKLARLPLNNSQNNQTPTRKSIFSRLNFGRFHRQPPNNVTNTQVTEWGTAEQNLTLKLGGCHPFLLQIAAGLVWEARQQGQDDSWVKQRFAEESERLPRARMGSRRWWRGLRWLVWDLPVRIGKIPKFIGNSLDDWSNWIVGIVILSVIILAVFGLVAPSDVKEWLVNYVKQALGVKE